MSVRVSIFQLDFGNIKVFFQELFEFYNYHQVIFHGKVYLINSKYIHYKKK